SVHVKLIARRAPIARKRLLRFLVRVPVTESRRIALDAKRPHLARLDLFTFRVNDARLVAFDDAPEASWLNIIGAVRDVDVEHLCGAYAVADFYSEGLHPTIVKLYGQSLAR